MARQVHNNVEGLYPALDRKKLAQLYVVDGKNFIVDLDGPKSAFGYDQPWHEFEDNNFMQTFTVGAEIFYFGRDSGETHVQISKMDWLLQQIMPLVKLPVTDITRPKLNLPWSHALVGTYHYFANRTWGVLRFDAINEAWTDVTATIGVEKVFYIAESDGRLIALADGLVAWSAVEDGMDFVTSLETGAGFQGLSIIGSLEQDKDYLGLQKISNGFLSFTSKGVLRSQIIDSLSPFRHITGESDEAPITPWCVTKISNTEVVILTRQGLFKSKSGLFEPWQPLMSEYLKQTLIPPMQSLNNGYVGIYYSPAKDEFYAYFATSQVLNSYTQTYALYLVRDQWGSFDRTHKGFVFIDPEARGVDFQQAYISIEGHLNWLNESVIPLVAEPQNANAVYVPVKVEYEAFYLEGVAIMPTVVRGHGFSYKTFPDVARFYEVWGPSETEKTAIAADPALSATLDVKYHGTAEVTDINTELHNIGLLSDYAVSVALTSGQEFTFTFVFVKGSSDDITFALRLDGAVFLFVSYNVVDQSFGYRNNVLGLVGVAVNLSEDRYAFSVTFTADATYTALTGVILYPAHYVLKTLLSGSQHFASISLRNTAAPTVELLTNTGDFANPAKWTAGTHATVSAGNEAFPTELVMNSEIIVLGPVAQALTQVPLDSYIEVGMLRFTDDIANDQLSLITNLAISCLDSTEVGGSIEDDWLLDYSSDVFVDWLAITPDEYEDWGLEVASGSSYTEIIKGSLDGYTPFEDQEIAPELVIQEGKTKFMTCENQGIFQTLRLNALEVGESYHLKTLEINGVVAGRI